MLCRYELSVPFRIKIMEAKNHRFQTRHKKEAD